MSVEPEDFRAALARWASGVAVVACRHDGRIVATTVSSFMSLSLHPPLVLLAIGPNATVLPFMQPGERFGISILAEGQRRLATIFADPFPVGPDPFDTHGTPLIAEAMVRLDCTIHETRRGGDHTIVIAGVERADLSAADRPLVRFDRRYRALEP